MKTTICASLDMNVVLEVRKRKLNLSSLFNSFLINYLKLPKEKNKTQDIEEELLKAETKVLELKKKKEKETKTAAKRVKVRIFG